MTSDPAALGEQAPIGGHKFRVMMKAAMMGWCCGAPLSMRR
jgi:hypothetical protein